MSSSPPDLASALRLVVLTDSTLAGSRGVPAIVEDSLAAGARAIQLRNKEVDSARLLEAARELRSLTRRFGALLFVNDRLDVALAAGADGVHLGRDDLPVAAVRAQVPQDFLIGYSTDDPLEAAHAVAGGADYLGCGTVYPTNSKADAGEVIGIERLERLARAVAVPVVGVGGITPARAREVARTSAAGVAAIGAVMGAADPAGAVRALLAPFIGRGDV